MDMMNLDTQQDKKPFHVSIKQMAGFVLMKPTAAEEEVFGQNQNYVKWGPLTLIVIYST